MWYTRTHPRMHSMPRRSILTLGDAETVETMPLNFHEWRGVTQLKDAFDRFEPLSQRSHLGEVIAERLVVMGLAERGRCEPKYAALGFRVGYRLSALGVQIHERGRFPRR